MSDETAPIDTIAEAAHRRSRLAERMGEACVAVVPAAFEQPRNRDVHHPFRQDSDFFYLTGFPEPEAVAVIAPGRPEGAFILFCRPKDAKREQWDGRRAGPEGAMADYGADQAHPLDQLDEELPKLLVGRRRVVFPLGRDVAWDRRLMGWLRRARGVARGCPTLPTTVELPQHFIHELRLIKSTAELEAMRRAAGVTVAAHRRAMQTVQAGMPEFELEAEMLSIFHRFGGQPAYPSIVAGGANACILHYVENRQRLRDGDLVLIDAGCELDGYAADITRTFPVNGTFSGEQRAVYELVLAAQQAAMDAVAPGRSFDDFHAAATRVLVQGMVDLGWLSGEVDTLIEEKAHHAFYPHRTGHWLGMDVHDVGLPGEDNRWRPLEPGMVVTVEPGLYVMPGAEGVEPRWHGIGVRIEDDVVVTEEGARNLTAGAPKAPDELEGWIAAAAGGETFDDYHDPRP